MSTQVKHPTPVEEAEERFDQACEYADDDQPAMAVVKAIRAAALLIASEIRLASMRRDG